MPAASATAAATRVSKRRRSSTAVASAAAAPPDVKPPKRRGRRGGRDDASPSRVLLRDGHGAALAAALAAAGETGRFADVKIVCGLGGGRGGGDPDSVLWSHGFLLAAASPFLGSLLGDSAVDAAAATLHLPDVRPSHLRMVLDYLYTGAMYLTAADLAPVLGVIETLRMTCGVSVSKMVRRPPQQTEAAAAGRRRRAAAAVAATAAKNERWVEEAKFGGLDQIKMELTEEESSPLPEFPSKEGAEEGPFQSPQVSPPRSEQPTVIAEEFAEEGTSVPSTSAPPEKESPVATIHAGESGAFEVVANSSDEEDLEEEEEEEAVEVNPDDMGEGDKDKEEAEHGKKGKGGGGVHSCVMCGKQFQHEDNLRTHLQNHLGAKAALRSCPACGNRIFRTALQLELHEASHRLARFHRRRVSRDEPTAAERAARAAVRRAAAHFVRKWERERKERKRREEEARRREEAKLAKATAKLLAGKKKLQIKLEKIKSGSAVGAASSSLSSPQPSPSPSALSLKVKFPVAQQLQKQSLLSRRLSAVPAGGNYCRVCEKAFSTAGSLRRHVKNFHSGVVVVPKHRAGSGVDDEDEDEDDDESDSESDSDDGSPSSSQRHRGRPPKKSLSAEGFPPVPQSPSAAAAAGKKRKRGRPSTSSAASGASSPSKAKSTSGPGRPPKADSDFTCPTCDRIFPAKSIFERHLKTSKHGSYAASESGLSTPPLSAPPNLLLPGSGPPLPHLNRVLQPTMELGGVTVNKYECHLCSKVFLRVKDLAKHREKACTAWM